MSGNGEQSDEKPKRDLWDYAEILSRPIAVVLSGFIIAGIGYFGQRTLTVLAEQEQDSRFVTELMARREESESALRKDMFSAVLKEFFVADSRDNISQQLLKLELLSENFGEALSLRPLFLDLQRNIQDGTSRADQAALRRLQHMARRVSDSQLSSLSIAGRSFSIRAPRSVWGASEGTPTPEAPQARYKWPTRKAEEDHELNPDVDIDDLIRVLGTLTVGDVSRSYTVTLSNINPMSRTVHVELIIDTLPSPPAIIEGIRTERQFDLNFFNFPMIDNTRLQGPVDQRFALVLTQFDDEGIEVEGICFPGIYASQRAKPFLDQISDELGSQRGKR